MFCIDDGHGAGERPITSVYRNDATWIAAQGNYISRTHSFAAEATGQTLLQQNFESALAAIPSGYGEGLYEGRRYGVTVRKSCDGKRTSLFARALAGGDVISFNLYRMKSGEGSLRPCEMPAEKVVAFVLGYSPGPPQD